MFFRKWRGVLAVAVCLAGAAPAHAADSGFTIDGAVKQTLHLTADDLKALPAVQADVAFEAKGKVEKGQFTGVPLLDLLNKAGIVDGAAKGARFRHVLEVAGRDGYVIAVAMGEIEPNLEGKRVLVAYLRNGKAMDPPGSLRLVVPGDKHGARSVYDLVRITVK